MTVLIARAYVIKEATAMYAQKSDQAARHIAIGG